MRVVDLFCGAGGLSLGFKRAGWEVVAAFDDDPSAVRVYHRLVGPEAEVADVRCLSAADLPEADAVVGGPPCQPYSLAGKRLRSADPRDGLPDFARLVQEARPRMFLLENVPLLASAPEMEHFAESVRNAGYAVDWRILNAADYGVPQTRRRLFVVGLRGARQVPASAWPLPTHSRHPGLFTERWVSAGSVLLPLLEARGPDLDRLPNWVSSRWWQVPACLRDEVLIHPQLSARGGGRRDYLNVRPLSLPAFTITASAAGVRYAHIVHAGRYWRVRPPEMAVLQGLPYLDGMTAKHIGNAVPPRLAEMLARALMEMETVRWRIGL